MHTLMELNTLLIMKAEKETIVYGKLCQKSNFIERIWSYPLISNDVQRHTAIKAKKTKKQNSIHKISTNQFSITQSMDLLRSSTKINVMPQLTRITSFYLVSLGYYDWVEINTQHGCLLLPSSLSQGVSPMTVMRQRASGCNHIS